MAYLAQIYEEARQVIGITDSFQGRKDTTATSGTAKEFSAAQAAGRLESKRVMKDAAYAALFEAMFKFKLAYADEPRPVVSHDIEGGPSTGSLTATTSSSKTRRGSGGGLTTSCSPATPPRPWPTTGRPCGRRRG